MRRLPLCFFLIAFSAPFAFADGTSISRAIPSSASTTAPNATSRTAATASRQNASRATITQSVQNASQTATAKESGGVARGVTSRVSASSDDSGVVRVGSRVLNLSDNNSAPARATTTGTSTSRAAGAPHTNTARDNLNATVNTVGRNARVQAASINNNPAIRRAGLSLRPSTAEVGGRATIAGTDIQTGSNIATEARAVSARATTNAETITSESIAAAQERMELVNNLNSSCQQQYNDCMDQFCAVIDTNQKRCSCSANVSDYAEVEEAVTNANNQLNDVAQRIRYVGLTEQEIEAIMSATEAEEALSGTRDNSETRSMLDEIEELIRDPTSGTSTYSYNTGGFGLDMDLDFTSNTADMFNLDFLNMNSNQSLSNMRGTQLYNAAKDRCQYVLDQCEEAGANIDQITANYDLSIDQDCITYEQGLTKMNETLVSNVRSANLMLQKARLAVLQNKNQYDAKGCIAALDECMRDDMVCGDEYTKCLDPTKNYIDENGDVILGQNITKIIDFMAGYNNASIQREMLQDSYNMIISNDSCSAAVSADGNGVGNNGACIVSYLLKKIGTKQEVAEEGMCRAVLDKCQNYTYDERGNYQPYNDIVVNYIQRAMVNIRAAQSQIISDYAANCMTDVANCYNQQVTQVNSWSSNASVSSIYNVMMGACRNVALTCAYAVFANDTVSCPDSNQNKCIQNLSQMFYDSMLCPDNSFFITNQRVKDTIENGCKAAYEPPSVGIGGTVTLGGYKYCKVNDKCACNEGYEVYNGQCLTPCGDNASRNSYGTCTCNNGYTLQNGVCVKTSDTITTVCGEGQTLHGGICVQL